MERLHAIMQLRKMETQASNAMADAEKHRRQIRRYQRKIHNYEWHLELGEEPGSSLQSMARAVVQLGTFIENERRYLQAAEVGSGRSRFCALFGLGMPAETLRT